MKDRPLFRLAFLVFMLGYSTSELLRTLGDWRGGEVEGQRVVERLVVFVVVAVGVVVASIQLRNQRRAESTATPASPPTAISPKA